MDARTITAFALMILIYIFFFQPTVPPPVATNSVVTQQTNETKLEEQAPPKAAFVESKNRALSEKIYKLQNQELTLQVNALGQILSAEIKRYKKSFDEPEEVNFKFSDSPLNRSQLLSLTGEPEWRLDSSGESFVEISAIDSGVQYQRRIELLKDQPYVLQVQESVSNLSKNTVRLTPQIQIDHPKAYETPKPGFWSTMIKPQTEMQSLNYYHDGGFHRIPVGDITNAQEVIGAVQYAGFSHRYFFMGAVPTDASIIGLTYLRMQNGDIRSELRFTEKQIPPGEKTSFTYQLFVGPKKLSELNKLGGQVGDVVEYGSWIGPISRFLLGIMNFFYSLIPNFGVAIILLTILVKILLTPLAYKASVSARRLQILAPKMQEIRERYKDDKFRMQQEVMTLYKTEKVNPFGGCLPLLLQFPIFIALYRLFFVSIEMRHAPFAGWIHDLSAHDPYLVTPILMTGLMWLQQKLTPMPPAMEENEAVQMQRAMLKWMPLFFGGLMLFLPAGLNLYFLTNAGFSIIQQIYLNRHLEMKYPLPTNARVKTA